MGTRRPDVDGEIAHILGEVVPFIVPAIWVFAHFTPPLFFTPPGVGGIRRQTRQSDSVVLPYWRRLSTARGVGIQVWQYTLPRA